MDENWNSWLKNLQGLLPIIAMVVVECLDVGLITLSKAAMSKGMNHFVFVLYSNAVASLILLPSLYFQRKNRPSLSLSLLFKFSLLSLAGFVSNQDNFDAKLCIYWSESQLSNTCFSYEQFSACTFLLAVFFGMEKLEIGNSKSQIKILATIVSISGALVVNIYKGPAILVSHTQDLAVSAPAAATNNWIIGGLFLLVADLCLAILNIALAAILKEYPSQTTILWFYYFFGTVQCSILTLAVERDPKAWILTHDVELISVLYSGVFGSMVTYTLQAWCIHKRGPIFVATFKPLGIAIAAFLSAIFLGDSLYIGSVVGSIFIVIGFYGVIWAQSEEGTTEIHGVSIHLNHELLFW